MVGKLDGKRRGGLGDGSNAEKTHDRNRFKQRVLP
jgi:hypothetical protein